jgi:hypothetical protein
VAVAVDVAEAVGVADAVGVVGVPDAVVVAVADADGVAVGVLVIVAVGGVRSRSRRLFAGGVGRLNNVAGCRVAGATRWSLQSSNSQ